MDSPAAPATLAPQVVSWIESVTERTVTSARQIPAGRRRGWFVDVGGPSGTPELFLQSGARARRRTELTERDHLVRRAARARARFEQGRSRHADDPTADPRTRPSATQPHGQAEQPTTPSRRTQPNQA